MTERTLDPKHLRTFLAVAELRSFTRAATRLGLRQSTVSGQVRALEATVGRTLLLRDTHRVSLTPDGEALIGYARGILASHRQALEHFAEERPRGRLRLGISDDLALSGLPGILREFRRVHPLVDVELSVDQSPALHRRVQNGKLDVILGKRLSGDGPGSVVRRERAVWVAAPNVGDDAAAIPRPVPLVLYRAPSISRALVLGALEGAAVPWRTRCLCRGVNGLIAAVAAGLGVSALSRSVVPPGLRMLGSEHGLPDLGHFDVVLATNARTGDTPSVRALTRAILQNDQGY